ncbi:hypothetical protein BJF78_21085 [Pseudonocardia sp. CNS-139]|nr:hypothetical protein BJF78_21085 [Pseudonocardia sp. CNS-139]
MALVAGGVVAEPPRVGHRDPPQPLPRLAAPVMARIWVKGERKEAEPWSFRPENEEPTGGQVVESDDIEAGSDREAGEPACPPEL